jgi:hypothetical protein
MSQKRGREEADETAPEPTAILKEVGDVGKGLVRGVPCQGTKVPVTQIRV